jgi:hypothetical protein
MSKLPEVKKSKIMYFLEKYEKKNMSPTLRKIKNNSVKIKKIKLIFQSFIII